MGLLKDGVTAWLRSPATVRNANIKGETLAPLLEELKFGVEGTTATMHIDAAGVRAAMAFYVPTAVNSEVLRKRSMSGGRIRKVIMACNVWAADHGGKWPKSLDVLVKSGAIGSGDLVSARNIPHRAYKGSTKEAVMSVVPVMWEVVEGGEHVGECRVCGWACGDFHAESGVEGVAGRGRRRLERQQRRRRCCDSHCGD